jgi:hypothetical protein
MRMRFGILAFVAGVALALPAAAPATVYTVKGTFTQPPRMSAQSGWFWLTATGQTASWTFDLRAQGSRPAVTTSRSVYLNFAMLATNTTNGGSGYNGWIRVTIQPVGGPPTRPPTPRTVTLINPFRPVDPASSGGVGYQVYGYTSVSTSLFAGGVTSLKVDVKLSGTSRNVAVNADSVFIGFSV